MFSPSDTSVFIIGTYHQAISSDTGIHTGFLACFEHFDWVWSHQDPSVSPHGATSKTNKQTHLLLSMLHKHPNSFGERGRDKRNFFSGEIGKRCIKWVKICYFFTTFMLKLSKLVILTDLNHFEGHTGGRVDIATMLVCFSCLYVFTPHTWLVEHNHTRVCEGENRCPLSNTKYWENV